MDEQGPAATATDAAPAQLTPLTRDAILGAQDIKTEWVAVPEWGGAVLVKGMTGRQRDAFEESLLEEKKGERKTSLRDFRAKLVAASVVYPESHDRMFSQSDVAKLSERSAAALARVCDVAQRLSGMTKDDVDDMVADLKNGRSAASS